MSEMVAVMPKTVVAPKSVYFTLLPGPAAVAAGVRFCGEGLKVVGCKSTACLQLPAARYAVPVILALSGPTVLTINISAVLVNLMVSLDGDVVT